jgi:hypothetical protein
VSARQAAGDGGFGLRMIREELRTRCSTIEEAYEFMLAYAAQGVSGDAAKRAEGRVRESLSRAAAALTGLASLYAALVELESLQPAGKYHAFLTILDRDAQAAHAAFEVVLSQPTISSQLVDNLNASIHVRALLTDLFLIDEILKAQAEPSSVPPTNAPAN